MSNVLIQPPQPLNSEIKWTDAYDICRDPIEPFPWLVEGLIPRFGAGSFDGPPESGKTTFLTSLAICLANGGSSFFGMDAVEGPVVIIGGEKSSRGAWRREFERLGKITRPDRFILPENDEPLFLWNRKNDSWIKTKACNEVLSKIRAIKPVLVVMDTVMRISMGVDEGKNTNQAQLGIELDRFAKKASCFVLVVGHTNQSSMKEPLDWRLHYSARSGGNGLPGILRYCLAATPLYPTDAPSVGLDETEIQQKKFMAIAVSKGNEIPYRRWTRFKPGIFEIKPNGSLEKLDEINIQNREQGNNGKNKRNSVKKDPLQCGEPDEHEKGGKNGNDPFEGL